MKKVLDLEISNLPKELSGLTGWSAALILFRFRSVPVARVEMPVFNGRIAGPDLRQKVADCVGPEICSEWLNSVLGEEEVNPEEAFRGRATIAICTRDRPDDLRNCLASLDRLPNDNQEILVVDNCPKTNATKEVTRAHGRARYLYEARPGLNRARNTALREAAGSVVAFIDDDAVADPGWLRGLVRNFSEPLAMAVTGLTMPSEIETPAQETFEKLSGFSRGFRRRIFTSENTPPAAAGAAGAGVNMAVRRDLLEAVGGFDEALDAGTATKSGGDTEILTRILAAGYRIVYEPAALNWHRHRRTWPELQDTMYGYGVGLSASWTRSLVVDKEWSVLKVGPRWFFKIQLRRLLRSLLRRPGAHPLDLSWAEFCGSLWGPCAYWIARRRVMASPRRS